MRKQKLDMIVPNSGKKKVNWVPFVDKSVEFVLEFGPSLNSTIFNRKTQIDDKKVRKEDRDCDSDSMEITLSYHFKKVLWL